MKLRELAENKINIKQTDLYTRPVKLSVGDLAYCLPDRLGADRIKHMILKLMDEIEQEFRESLYNDLKEVLKYDK